MIRFGPSGNSKSFYDQGKASTVQTAEWLFERGLDAFEYSFGLGVSLSDKKAAEIGAEFKKYGVAVSVHAPYYINLANESPEAVQKSYGYLYKSAEKCLLLGGDRVVFHIAALGKRARSEVLAVVKERLFDFCLSLKERGFDGVSFCPETMGKINQFGDLEEITELCTLDDGLLPALDFGHLNARTLGGFRTVADFDKAVAYVINRLPREKVEKMHVHFTKIQYSKSGEVRHLTNADGEFGPEFAPFAEVIVKYGLLPRIISESDGTQAEDAAEMKAIYLNALSRGGIG